MLSQLEKLIDSEEVREHAVAVLGLWLNRGSVLCFAQELCSSVNSSCVADVSRLSYEEERRRCLMLERYKYLLMRR